MDDALELARRAAPARSTVLLTGETGTGKEVLAELIHRESGCSDGPFVRVNCAALPEALLESELFGHERGAFTGADRRHIGRFEEATGGTLFLDEIAELSPATQAKLLRALQEREFRRVGGVEPLRVDARIIAATNRDLPTAIAAGEFREDLFFRLNVVHIELPPLRERGDDALALADGFVTELAAELRRPGRFLTRGARQAIRAHPWPGNVRELRNAIERALLLSDGPAIEREALGLEPVRCAAPRVPLPLGGGGESLRLHDAERRLVVEALERSGYVQKAAAVLLGISPRKLNYLVAKFGITHSSWRRHVPPDPSAGAASSPEGEAVESPSEVR